MKKTSLLVIAALFFSFFPISPQAFFNSLQNVSAAQAISGTVEWTEDKVIDSDVNISSSNATLIIKKGVTISFKNHSNINISYGTLLVSGTVKDPVKFKAADDSGKGYSIKASSSGKIQMRNADISDGGYTAYQSWNTNSIFNSAYASVSMGAIYIDNGHLDMQGCNLRNNVIGIYINSGIASNIKVNRTKFINNLTDVQSSFYSGSGPDFRYNWWGEAGGPKKICPTCAVYEKISGKINFSDWLATENFRDPVIIIPGVMGSWEVDGEWKLDPFLHSYENIYNKLVQEGYEPNEDLFKFPYQWRNSNVENAALLKNAITALKIANNWPKVDIVAHSMGGLLAREYIENENIYGNDVDQLITVGTPHKGAPKTYLGWEAGEMGKDFGSYILEKILTREAKKAGYNSLFHYIRNIPEIRNHAMESVRELLPQYNYIFDLDLNAPRIYPADYPQNGFLENLNSPAKLKNLLKVENDIIYGKVDSENTISAFEVIHAPAFGEYWEHGYPKSYDSLFWGEEGVIYGEGDETVPVSSATGIDADYKIPVKASHNNLTTEAQTDIVELLTGSRPDADSEVRDADIDIKDILLIQVYCPVDIKVIDQYGKTIGRNINDFVSRGAVYVNNGDNEEFITIPHPEDLEYRVVAEGTNGGGDYKVEVTRIKEDQTSSQLAQVSETILKGTTSLDKIIDEKTFKLEEGKVLSSDTTLPTISTAFPENKKSYLNDQIVPINYAISDDISAPNKIAKTIEYDGQPFTGSQIDLSLQKLGGHTLKITAVDEAGNRSEQPTTFQISTNLDAIQNNINHYFDLGLIKKKIAKRYLAMRLAHLENLFNLLEKAKNSKLKPKPKQAAIDALKKVINVNIDIFIKQINRKSPRWIDPKAAEFLIEDLNKLKNF